MARIALSKPDKDSHFLNCQVEHIEIAGMLKLGEFDDDKIHVKNITAGVMFQQPIAKSGQNSPALSRFIANTHTLNTSSTVT